MHDLDQDFSFPTEFDRREMLNRPRSGVCRNPALAGRYIVGATHLDLLPVGAFLVEAVTGTAGQVPLRLTKLAVDKAISNYAKNYSKMVTIMGRTIRTVWELGQAVDHLSPLRLSRGVEFVIYPSDGDVYSMLEAFEASCQLRRAAGKRNMRPTLMCKALGLPDTNYWSEIEEQIP